MISQSFASAEDAFASTQSLQNLRHAFVARSPERRDGARRVRRQRHRQHDEAAGQPGRGPDPLPDRRVAGFRPAGHGHRRHVPLHRPDREHERPGTLYVGPVGRCNANPTQTDVGWTFSGGGFSDVFAKPSWQNTLPAGSTAIGAWRGVPDVAYQASAATGGLVYVSLPPDGNDSDIACGGSPCSPGWWDIGGTSLSTPQWAGLIAIADQMNGAGLGLINPALYAIAGNPAKYAADFFDVTTGNNTQAGTGVAGYPATAGWDPVTGLGTPDAAKLLPDLVYAVNHP